MVCRGFTDRAGEAPIGLKVLDRSLGVLAGLTAQVEDLRERHDRREARLGCALALGHARELVHLARRAQSFVPRSAGASSVAEDEPPRIEGGKDLLSQAIGNYPFGGQRGASAHLSRQLDPFVGHLLRVAIPRWSIGICPSSDHRTRPHPCPMLLGD